ncbi:UDP-N-acetylmuramoyl-L-alanine--D-glutamate ligase [bacterium endosymbiont of Pedicinus badii]|uniref:UDP-N-acetylmuramoyl-L-alanine--D-glutamate ligase n=1 Tax=bacterium endosymbiont of Pedicinus badii TaxID=1719126 RepID=UPI0009B986DE|nr:UDP-N-acetylmuramoyl-L-alanine--D-glutamate ligase [bacterium endosymbiont of Pedicinus badii]OQM34218.1 hypothetical protein AOQ89_02700 [bacterium endosymbiont of Pedicinus badii]
MKYNYKKEKILIFGLGITGISCLNFFLKKKIFPKVIDTKIFSLQKYIPNFIKCHFGSIKKSWILKSTLIIMSPGISYKKYPIFNEAKKKGTIIISDIELFCREAKSPILAITGSNGKSTVATLLHKIISSYGYKAKLGGNIGIPAMNILSKKNDFYILEISSFQLENTYNLNSFASTVLNITQDHIDRHKKMEEYKEKKMRIYQNSQFCIVNLDFPCLFPKNRKKKECITFGKYKGDYCLKKKENDLWITKKRKFLLNCSETKIFGICNYINFLSVIAFSDLIGIPHNFSLPIIKNFLGLEHRMQILNSNNGIKYINDSKSTNIGSLIAAVESIKSTGFLHILVGGISKNADFSCLSEFLKNRNCYLYCFGVDGKKISNFFPNNSYYFHNISKAMKRIHKIIKKGDIVLLSPACSSLDQFKNFQERGKKFVYLVEKYKHKKFKFIKNEK